MSSEKIPFSPPDITELEILEVSDTLRSGWITTGPKTARFEKMIGEYCLADRAVCLSSATAGLELSLRLFDIGEGDEVITTPYTYAATANVILHTGARPVFADVRKGEYNIDPVSVESLITEKTKAVISVDVGGLPCDYDGIKEALEIRKRLFSPAAGTRQEGLDRPVYISDAAHSLGARYKGRPVGSSADFTVFSFHAVKNVTTAEGGAIVFSSSENWDPAGIEKTLRLLSLHGQDKDALSKTQLNSWRYSIEIPGYKCNMTDIQASLGIVQLGRYEKEMIPWRKKIAGIYNSELGKSPGLEMPVLCGSEMETSYHLFMARLRSGGETERDAIISGLAEKNIAANVHYIPVVMHPAYTKLGYSIGDYPNTYHAYEREITLPLYSTLPAGDAHRVCDEILGMLK
jgi:dTDP-4-amino-4,6-dideoxygalactose transaminase